jgi:hypothetical protein
LIQALSAIIISTMYGYYDARPCGQILETFKGSQEATLHFYPECASYFSGANPGQYAVVHADMDGTAIEVAVALGLNFGAATWLALALHAIGVEIYVSPISALAIRAIFVRA